MSDAAILGLPSPTATAAPAMVERLRELVRSPHPLPDELGVFADGDALVAALAAVGGDACTRHRELGIDEAVTRATLQDVGRKHRLYGAASVLPWIVGLLRADVVELGRLQVERRRGRHGHALHIPETGPLQPTAVDESLARAREFTGATAFSCESWLLDPRLQHGLPGSNIAAFAARFEIVEPGAPSTAASADAAKFVFRRSLADVRTPGAVTSRTRLEQLVAAELRSGDWTEPVGVLRMPPG
jgi:hypothetical protein